MRYGYGSVTHFHVRNAEILAGIDIILELVSNQKRLKQGSAEIYRYVVRLVSLDFLSKVGGDIGCTEAELDDVDVWSTNTHKLMDLRDAESLVHNHGNAGRTWLYKPVGHLGKMKIHEERIIASSKLQKFKEQGLRDLQPLLRRCLAMISTTSGCCMSDGSRSSMRPNIFGDSIIADSSTISASFDLPSAKSRAA